MCLCRGVIYWFCLVGTLCSEWHKSSLHYTIKGPLMQRACEHDGFSEDQQSFEGERHSVSLNAACPTWLCKSSTDSLKNEPGYCRKLFGFRSFTQLLITFYFPFQNISPLKSPDDDFIDEPPRQSHVALHCGLPACRDCGHLSQRPTVNMWRDGGRNSVQSCPTQSPTCCGVEGGHNHPPSNGGFGLLNLSWINMTE